MSEAPFAVASIEPVVLEGPPGFAAWGPMSPYVWPLANGRFAMLLRAVPPDASITGLIWYAEGDGLRFAADPASLLAPGPDPIDLAGCEDPTVAWIEGECIVYYTGLRPDGVAQLLCARGPDVRAIRKCGVAHASTASDRNTKEATLERLQRQWLLLFEYSRDGRSRVGKANGPTPLGPWQEQADPFLARPDAWDCHHLSTGPLVLDASRDPVMFYNGSDGAANWAIGWIELDQTCSHAIARSAEPLIVPGGDPAADGRLIAFANSAVCRGSRIWLYFTHNDCVLYRATIERR